MASLAPKSEAAMPLPPGRTVRLTPARRLMCDFLHFSRQVPIVAVERYMDLGPLVRARQALADRPGWFALFLKAFALVARRWEPLRTSFLRWPWPRLHVHGCSVAALPMERRVGDEDAVLLLPIRRPDEYSLPDLEAVIRRAKAEPLEAVGPFRRQLRCARLPSPARRLLWWLGLHWFPNARLRFFGTFGITGVARLGAPSLHVLSPFTCMLSYGVIPADGAVLVRLFYDHRVMDGVVPACALEDLETTLRGPIAEELHALARAAA
jgi:hypothetical protein